ncbi:MAG TPA: hypothetical protein EYO94_12845 [Acidobacteria bacterium]|nr:hypothetical protein [Acidobacteriota bacterium]
MRVLSLVVSMMLVAGTAAAQQNPPAAPAGDLAEVMRGILFPNSNILFDAQSTDPGAPPDESNANEGGASARFAGVYTGWESVENAAIALAEAANLITLPGRTCENGQPVPIDQDNWAEFTRGLREAGEIAYRAALNKSQDEVIDATNYIAEACSNCHGVYRDSYSDPPKERCVP